MSYKVLITKEINNAGKEFLKESGYESKILSPTWPVKTIEDKDEFDCISVLSV